MNQKVIDSKRSGETNAFDRKTKAKRRRLREKYGYDKDYPTGAEEEFKYLRKTNALKRRGEEKYVNGRNAQNVHQRTNEILIDVIYELKRIIRAGGYQPPDFRNQGYERNEVRGYGGKDENDSNECIEVNVKIPWKAIKSIGKKLNWLVFWLILLYDKCMN